MALALEPCRGLPSLGPVADLAACAASRRRQDPPPPRADDPRRPRSGASATATRRSFPHPGMPAPRHPTPPVRSRQRGRPDIEHARPGGQARAERPSPHRPERGRDAACLWLARRRRSGHEFYQQSAASEPDAAARATSPYAAYRSPGPRSRGVRCDKVARSRKDGTGFDPRSKARARDKGLAPEGAPPETCVLKT